MKQSRSLRLLATLLVVGLFALPIVAQAPAKAKESDKAPAAMKMAALVDINSASIDQLKALPGIGDAYSKKIVDGRPYDKKDQLVSKSIIPQATYDKISSMIVAKQAAKKK